MKRLLFLLACLCPCLGFAQTIYVSVTYTPGAAAAAIAHGTNITDKINNAFTPINNAYSASGIGITLVPIIHSAGNTAPPDSASMDSQYAWVHSNPTPWQYRGTGIDSASISVHISDTPGATGSVTAPFPINLAADSTIATPYAYIDSTLELALSRVMGASTTGYSNRVRSFPGDPPLNGTNYCYHTRESPLPSDPSTIVPVPASYMIYFQTGFIAQTQSVTEANSCQAFYSYFIALYGGAPTYAHFAVVPHSGVDYCDFFNSNNNPSDTGQAALIAQAGNAGGTITCTEVGYGNYSKNANMGVSPYLPLGDATHDSVGSMNAKASRVAGWAGLNATILAKVKAGFWSAIFALFN